MGDLNQSEVEPSTGSDLAYREEIVKQLFGDVGEIITDFSCAVESNILLHGRMYVTDRFLCFYSNLFGLEKKIRIPYSHISLITKEKTALVIPNAIAITTFRKEYIFRSFWDRDECFKMLKDLVNKHKGIDTVDTDASIHDTEAMTTTPSETASSTERAVGPVGDSTHSASEMCVQQNENRNNCQVDKQTHELAKVPATPPPQSDQGSSSTKNNTQRKDLDDTEEDTESGREEFDRKRAPTTVDLNDAFEKELAKSKLKIRIAPVEVNISVEEFAQMFVIDDAPCSYKCYHEATQDKDVMASSWEDDSTALGAGRELRFLKPVSLPGLTHARAKKVQRYRKFGNVGLIVCSSTRMEDVPAADTFTVEDMVVVRSVAARKIVVEANFEVKWIKSTIFRRMIESNTIPDVTKWLEKFLVHIKNSAEKQDERNCTITATKPVIEPPSVELLKSSSTVQESPAPEGTAFIVDDKLLWKITLPLVWVLTLLVLLYSGSQLSSLRGNVSTMRSQLEENTRSINALRDQVTYGAIRDGIADTLRAIDKLKTDNDQKLWESLALSMRDVSDQAALSIDDGDNNCIQSPDDGHDTEEARKACIDLLRDPKMLLQHHTVEELSRIYSFLHDLREKIPVSF